MKNGYIPIDDLEVWQVIDEKIKKPRNEGPADRA